MSLDDKIRAAMETFTRGVIDEIAAIDLGELIDEVRAEEHREQDAFEAGRFYFDVMSSYPASMLVEKKAFIRAAFSTTNGKEHEAVSVRTGKVIVRRKHRNWVVRDVRNLGYTIED
ncbi:MAG TPA: hypothetical protein VGS96_09810 [Thermoanaerobaculia bacterium]|jgi:hypothetical protein|nr:hypothetical protein [Thermoanaerobaculia bacterium]